MVATLDECAEIDEQWPGLRPVTDVQQVWRWQEIYGELREVFCVRAEGSIVAIWGSTSSRPRKLVEGTYYRLDYLELSPLHRGKGNVAGLFLMGMVASRALEVSATGIVLTCFNVPGVVAYYAAAGATVGCPRGWNHPTGVVALTFDQRALHNLKDLADALLKENA